MGENKLEAIDARLEEQQIFGSTHCPICSHRLEGKPEWFGLPAGVKFDPSDQELIERHEAKVEAKDVISHPLIDEFLTTIEDKDGSVSYGWRECCPIESLKPCSVTY